MREHVKEDLSGEPLGFHNVVVGQTAGAKKTEEMKVSSDEESTDLPFFAERSKRPTTSKPLAWHAVFSFRTHEDLPDLPSCRSRPKASGSQYSQLRTTSFVCSVVSQSWYPTKNKTAQMTMEYLIKFVPPDQRTKFIHIFLEVIRVCGDFCVGITTRQRHTE